MRKLVVLLLFSLLGGIFSIAPAEASTLNCGLRPTWNPCPNPPVTVGVGTYAQPRRVISTGGHLRLEWNDSVGRIQSADITASWTAYPYKPTAGTAVVVPVAQSASPMSVTWTGPPPRTAGCTGWLFNYRRGGYFNETVYRAHLQLYWCFYGDHIQHATCSGCNYGVTNPVWWFSDIAPFLSPFGNVSYTRYWNPFPGRAYDSSTYIRVSQGVHQICVPAGCWATEYPFIWVSALGNGQAYWDAGHG